jgi:hypothetical protein
MVNRSGESKHSKGFTTIGTLLLIGGLSLPAIVSVVTFRANWCLLYTAIAIWLSSAVGTAGTIAGNYLSKKKIEAK